MPGPKAGSIEARLAKRYAAGQARPGSLDARLAARYAAGRPGPITPDQFTAAPTTTQTVVPVAPPAGLPARPDFNGQLVAAGINPDTVWLPPTSRAELPPPPPPLTPYPLAAPAAPPPMVTLPGTAMDQYLAPGPAPYDPDIPLNDVERNALAYERAKDPNAPAGPILARVRQSVAVAPRSAIQQHLQSDPGIGAAMVRGAIQGVAATGGIAEPTNEEAQRFRDYGQTPPPQFWGPLSENVAYRGAQSLPWLSRGAQTAASLGVKLLPGAAAAPSLFALDAMEAARREGGGTGQQLAAGAMGMAGGLLPFSAGRFVGGKMLAAGYGNAARAAGATAGVLGEQAFMQPAFTAGSNLIAGRPVGEGVVESVKMSPFTSFPFMPHVAREAYQARANRARALQEYGALSRNIESARRASPELNALNDLSTKSLYDVGRAAGLKMSGGRTGYIRTLARFFRSLNDRPGDSPSPGVDRGSADAVQPQRGPETGAPGAGVDIQRDRGVGRGGPSPDTGVPSSGGNEPPAGGGTDAVRRSILDQMLDLGYDEATIRAMPRDEALEIIQEQKRAEPPPPAEPVKQNPVEAAEPTRVVLNRGDESGYDLAAVKVLTDDGVSERQLQRAAEQKLPEVGGRQNIWTLEHGRDDAGRPAIMSADPRPKESPPVSAHQTAPEVSDALENAAPVREHAASAPETPDSAHQTTPVEPPTPAPAVVARTRPRPDAAEGLALGLSEADAERYAANPGSFVLNREQRVLRAQYRNKSPEWSAYYEAGAKNAAAQPDALKRRAKAAAEDRARTQYQEVYDELLRRGAKLRAESSNELSDSLYFELNGQHIRLSDHTANDATQNWLDRVGGSNIVIRGSERWPGATEVVDDITGQKSPEASGTLRGAESGATGVQAGESNQPARGGDSTATGVSSKTPAPAKPKGRFTISGIVNTLYEHMRGERGLIQTDPNDAINQAGIVREYGETRDMGDPFTFAGDLPGEVKDRIRRNPKLRSRFRTNVKGAVGDDIMHAMGDRYWDLLEDTGTRRRELVERYGDKLNDQVDPPDIMLAWQILKNVPDDAAGKMRKSTELDPKSLPTNSEWEHLGHKYRIEQDADGYRLLKDGDGFEPIPVDYLDSVPVDKGTLKKPFYEPTEAQSGKGVFGQDVTNPITGEQKPLFHEPVESPLPPVERVGSRNASDPRHTPSMFEERPGMKPVVLSDGTTRWVRADADAIPKAVVRDVTPDGYGPAESNYSEPFNKDTARVHDTEVVKLQNSLNEDETLLRDTRDPAKRANIERRIAATRAKLDQVLSKYPDAPKSASEIEQDVPQRNVPKDRGYGATAESEPLPPKPDDDIPFSIRDLFNRETTSPDVQRSLYEKKAEEPDAIQEQGAAAVGAQPRRGKGAGRAVKSEGVGPGQQGTETPAESAAPKAMTPELAALIKKRKQLQLILDATPFGDAPEGSAAKRAYDARVAPLKKQLAELDKQIGPRPEFFRPRPFSQQVLARLRKQYDPKATGSFWSTAERKAPGIDEATATAALAPLNKRFAGIPVRVIAGEAEMPGPVQDKVKQLGLEGLVRGFVHEGTVYVVRGNVHDAQEAFVAGWHEIVGHIGADAKLTEPQRRKVWEYAEANEPELVKFVRDNYTEARQLGEVVARLSERFAGTAPPAWYRNILKLIRYGWRRAMGRDFDIQDVERIIQLAARKAELMDRGLTAMEASIMAWHGSKHEFDRFDSSKIGTGEGAQAYGYGLYFAGKKEVAEYYRQSLAGNDVPEGNEVQINGIPIDKYRSYWGTKPQGQLRGLGASDTLQGLDHIEYYANLYNDPVAGLDEAMRVARNLKDQGPEYAQAVKIFENNDVQAFFRPGQRKGRTYQVELAPKEEELLDWDKPLSEQSETVKKALAFEVRKETEPSDSKWLLLSGDRVVRGYDTAKEAREALQASTGEELYRTLSAGQSDQWASAHLKSLGIRGIKYLDQGSRNTAALHITPPSQTVAGDWMVKSDDYNSTGKHFATEAEAIAYLKSEQERIRHNYVIFDDADTKITGKFSVAGGPKPGIRLTPETALDTVRRKLQDEFLRLEQAQKDIAEQGGTVDESTDLYTKANLYGSRAAAQIAKVERDFVDPIVQTAAKAGFVEFANGDIGAEGLPSLREYLTALHAPSRNRVIRQRDPNNPAGSGMTDAEAGKIVRDVLNSPQAQAYKEIADRVHAMNRQTLKLELDSGLIDQAAYDQWSTQWDNYVPLRTDMEPNVRAGRGFSLLGREHKSALGRGDASDDPLTFSIMQAHEKIVRAEKNRVGQSLLKLVEDNAADLADVMRVVPHPTQRVLKAGEVATGPDPMFRLKDNVISVKRDGKEVLIEMAGPEGELFTRAFKRLGVHDGGRVIQFLSGAMRVMRSVNTNLNPAFVIPNILRDLQMAGISLASEHSVQMAKDAVVGWKKAAKAVWDLAKDHNAKPGEKYHDYAREWIEHGGKIGVYRLQDFSGTNKELVNKLRDIDPTLRRRAWNAGKSALKVVDRINGAAENAIRLSAYVEARSRGASPQKAAILAKDLTVNFTRKGEWGNTLNSLFMFYNAQMQGATKTTQLLAKTRGSRTSKAIVGGALMGGLVASVAMRALLGQDDEGRDIYDTIPDEERDANLILPGKGKVYGKMPLPYGYNTLFSIGRNIGDVIAGAKTPGAAALSIGNSVVGSFSPFGHVGTPLQAVAPTVLDPAAQVYENRKWTGEQLGPEQNPFGPPEPDSELFDRRQSKLSVEIARWLNRVTGGDKVTPGRIDINPATLDVIAETVLGGLGRVANQAVKLPGRISEGEVRANDLPILSRFVGQERQGINSDEFYNSLRSIEQARTRAKYYEERGDKESLDNLRRESRIDLITEPAAKEAEKKVRKLREDRDMAKNPKIYDEAIEKVMSRFNRYRRQASTQPATSAAR